MSLLPTAHAADPSLRLLALPLRALGRPGGLTLLTSSGLPSGAIEIVNANLVLAATPCAHPMFDGVAVYAADRLGKDVVITRTGLHPETLDPVTSDVALHSTAGVISLTDMLFARHEDGGLWLVRHGGGPYVQITPGGLRLEMESPFVTWHEVGDAACRAAAEIVRLSAGAR